LRLLKKADLLLQRGRLPLLARMLRIIRLLPHHGVKARAEQEIIAGVSKSTPREMEMVPVEILGQS
jgi:hypothetical protein